MIWFIFIQFWNLIYMTCWVSIFCWWSIWTNYILFHIWSVHYGRLAPLDGQIYQQRISRSSIQLQCLKQGTCSSASFWFLITMHFFFPSCFLYCKEHILVAFWSMMSYSRLWGEGDPITFGGDFLFCGGSFLPPLPKLKMCRLCWVWVTIWHLTLINF